MKSHYQRRFSVWTYTYGLRDYQDISSDDEAEAIELAKKHYRKLAKTTTYSIAVVDGNSLGYGKRPRIVWFKA